MGMHAAMAPCAFRPIRRPRNGNTDGVPVTRCVGRFTHNCSISRNVCWRSYLCGWSIPFGELA